MTLAEVLNDLGREVGVDMTLNDGACTLAFDDMPVTIQEHPEIDTISIFAKIADKPAYPLEQLYSAVLMANHLFQGTAGSTISVEPETGDFFLCLYLSSVALEPQFFRERLERFVNTLSTWQTLISSYRPDESKKNDKSGEEDEDDENISNNDQNSDFMMRI